MHTEKTKNQFLALRIEGWSLARIADELGVSKPTLVAWNREFSNLLHCFRTVELEALQERFLIAHRKDLDRLSGRQKAIENELSRRKLSEVPTDKLFRLASLMRQQIQKAREASTVMENASQYIPLPTPGGVCNLSGSEVSAIASSIDARTEDRRTKTVPSKPDSEIGKETVKKR